MKRAALTALFVSLAAPGVARVSGVTCRNRSSHGVTVRIGRGRTF